MCASQRTKAYHSNKISWLRNLRPMTSVGDEKILQGILQIDSYESSKS